MSFQTATLDANDEAFEISVPFGCSLAASMNITGTITVTWAAYVEGGANALTVKGSNGGDQVFTSSDHFHADAGGYVYVATASGVSSGSCAIEVNVGRSR